MDLGFLNALAASGGGWVIYLLLAASVGVVAIFIERGIELKRERAAFTLFKGAVGPFLEAGDLAGAAGAAKKQTGAGARILAAGLARPGAGAAAAEERMAAARLVEKKALDHRLLVLGTLGNNAPFIGLFGTVLGVIKAFRDLAMAGSAGPEDVMQGLAEALIATAVGLLVAIPSVIAYNLFQKAVGDLLIETDALSRLLLAAMKEERR